MADTPIQRWSIHSNDEQEFGKEKIDLNNNTRSMKIVPSSHVANSGDRERTSTNNDNMPLRSGIRRSSIAVNVFKERQDDGGESKPKGRNGWSKVKEMFRKNAALPTIDDDGDNLDGSEKRKNTTMKCKTPGKLTSEEMYFDSNDAVVALPEV